MSKQNPDLDLFARVVDGEIKEYPVCRLHIQNRAQPISWYTPVVEAVKPEVPKFHYTVEKLTVGENEVVQSFEVVPYTLQELLSNLRINTSGVGVADDRPIIESVDPELVAQIMQLISDYVTDRLSDFAATRQYGSKAKNIDPFISAATYVSSKNEKYRLESNYLLDTRDAIWANLEVYQAGVLSGTTPVPISIDEIDALIPELVWPEVPAAA